PICWRRSGRIDPPLTSKSQGQRSPATSLVNGKLTHWTRLTPRRRAISLTISTSNPPLRWSRSSPSTNGGLGSSVPTVSTPGVRVRNSGVPGAAPPAAGCPPLPPPQAASSRVNASASSLPTPRLLLLPTQRTWDGTIPGALVGWAGNRAVERLAEPRGELVAEGPGGRGGRAGG